MQRPAIDVRVRSWCPSRCRWPTGRFDGPHLSGCRCPRSRRSAGTISLRSMRGGLSRRPGTKVPNRHGAPRVTVPEGRATPWSACRSRIRARRRATTDRWHDIGFGVGDSLGRCDPTMLFSSGTSYGCRSEPGRRRRRPSGMVHAFGLGTMGLSSMRAGTRSRPSPGCTSPTLLGHRGRAVALPSDSPAAPRCRWLGTTSSLFRRTTRWAPSPTAQSPIGGCSSSSLGAGRGSPWGRSSHRASRPSARSSTRGGGKVRGRSAGVSSQHSTVSPVCEHSIKRTTGSRSPQPVTPGCRHRPARWTRPRLPHSWMS